MSTANRPKPEASPSADQLAFQFDRSGDECDATLPVNTTRFDAWCARERVVEPILQLHAAAVAFVAIVVARASAREVAQ